MTGKFIVFDGLDGTGKTTFIKMLSEYLESKGFKVSVTAEPTKGPSGVLIREILGGAKKASQEELAALFLADRIAHNSELDELINEGNNPLRQVLLFLLAYQADTIQWAGLWI